MSQKVHPKGFRLRSTGNNAPRFKVPNSNSSIQVSSENLQNEVGLRSNPVSQNTLNGTRQCET
jgi:hypothetical protein